MGEVLLKVENLKMVFQNKKSSFAAVEGLSFTVEQGKTLGIVGESGSGKTMASLSVLRLLPNQGRVAEGEITFKGKNLLKLSEKEMQELRGNEMSMIFQDPVMSLDQIYTVGDQIIEAILTHEKMPKADAKKRALSLLGDVGIPHPERVYRSYPFELSGGMCQRVMIAIALSCNPKLLFADEPTTALDVTVQAQILYLIKEACRKLKTAVLFISHDLGVISEICDSMAVMYSGHIVESGDTASVLTAPSHPYTRALIGALPRFTGSHTHDRLTAIPGMVPDPSEHIGGCRFAPRCPKTSAACREGLPPPLEIRPGHRVYCCHPEEV